MEEIDFESDSFSDITAKDDRYDARAYALLMDVVNYLSGDKHLHMDAAAIMDEFKERTLDQYGPLSYTVLREWGVHSCEDIGEMMFNLTEGNRVRKDENDTAEAFTCGYDFKEAFLDPYGI
ncbi:MAG: hypothetical protein K6F50_02410 [Kiritimatiellae bacterium]|nr:hypothetical protein [Kiritimatiellia bacterium]